VLEDGKQYFAGGFATDDMLKDVGLLNHSGVEKYSAMINFDDIDVRINNYLYQADIKVIDSVFMQILDFPFISGVNISGPEDALITESFAKKVFGDKYPVGEKIYHPATKRDLTITGVIGQPKDKSSVTFDVAISTRISSFWGQAYQCFVLLYPGVNSKDINGQYGEYKQDWKRNSRHQLFPYKDIYFDRTADLYAVYGHGNYMYVLILAMVGGLLLLTGIINYMNIHAVIMRRRNKEFGMKKVFGAGGLQIFTQLLCENLIVTVLSVIIALWFSELLSPIITNSMHIEQSPNRMFDIALSTVLITVFSLTTSITPYIRYRYTQPVKSLRAIGAGNKSLFSGRFFLCFQYLITMVMIVVSLFFVKQLNFMIDYDLGYRTKNIIKVPFRNDGMLGVSVLVARASEEERAQSYAKYVELRQKLDACTFIEHWSDREKSPNSKDGEAFIVDMKLSSSEDKHKVVYLRGDEEWFNLFEFQLVDGKMWEEYDVNQNPVIVSESLIKQFGITDYNDVELEMLPGGAKLRIIGTVKDFYTTRLSEKQYPAFITQELIGGDNIVASFAPEHKQEVIGFMKNLHDEIVGGEFTYSFVENEVAEMYENDKRIAFICSMFTAIAIFVSILGLFGLSLFDIRQRRKEIAIRKINGARIIDIVRLLLKKYFVLLGVAFIVAAPIALFVIQKYLENFALKAPVSWWLFAMALVVTVAVSLMTLLYQTYKAGNENPANVVKSET
jgi:ABC-type antimicrobial peptide transport system permease subunit